MPKDLKAYTAWLLVLEAAVIGTFLARDLFLFFVFFEAVLLPMYFLIAGWGYANRAYAALKFFVFTLAGSAFLLVGIIVLVAINANQNGGRITFDLEALSQTNGVADSRLLFLALHDRLRRQGADSALPHVAARRPHRGADRRLGCPGRRHAEARHLRHPPLSRSSCSQAPLATCRGSGSPLRSSA